MRVEVVARGVEPDAAWAWWTDFREGGADHRFARWAHPERRVEERGGGRLAIEERARVGPLRYREVVEVTLAKPELRFDARSTFGAFRGAFRFLPDPRGTRVVVAWEMRLVPWLRALGPLGRGVVGWFYAWDLRQHVAELEREAGRLALDRRAAPRPQGS